VTLAGFVLILHSYNVYLVLAAGLITAIWGLILYFRSSKKKDMQAIPRSWNILLRITAGLALLQGLFGIIMVTLGLKPGSGTGLYYLHYVYGGIVALVIPLAYLSYTTGGKNPRRDVLIYSIALLILVAAGVRAWMTGPVR
jgi:heme A synthase